jgi:hypothetical protein
MEVNEDGELWKQIDEYENYEVSSFGNIRNKNTGRILKAANIGGYYCVGLSKGKTKTFSVHQLVAKAFIENPENKQQVNHKDKNGLNNNINNLEWCNNQENSIHRSAGVKQTTNQNLQIYRIDLNTNEILEKFNSIEDGAKWVMEKKLTSNLNSARGCISSCIREITNSSYGFKWKKVEQNSLEDEEWREVIINNNKTEGYFVSSLGRFKNKKGVIMKDYKPHHSGYIYLRVNIQKYALHRLIAQTFIPNLENKPFVNHIDGNKTNNSVSNLEWCTCSENNLHNHKVGLNKGHKRKIIQYDLEMNELKKFDKILDASKELNISLSCIKDVLKGKQKSSKGFIFKYLD